MSLDIRVIELIASRVCHDLVSPVGAIRNGLELIEELEDEPAGGFIGEAVKLIAHSSGQADKRLRVFRLAYGLAGREQKGFADTRAAAAGWLEGGRIRLDWPAGVPNDQLAFKRGAPKLLLNLILLAEEVLSHGGTIAVTAEGDEAAGRITITATAAGRPAVLKPESVQALAGAAAAADLTPRTIHAYITGRFAEDDGFRVTAAPAGPEALALTAAW